MAGDLVRAAVPRRHGRGPVRHGVGRRGRGRLGGSPGRRGARRRRARRPRRRRDDRQRLPRNPRVPARTGHAEITDFAAGGRGHDVIGLSAGDGASSVAEILAQTTMRDGSAVVAVTPDDTITLDGATEAQLAHHPNDVRILA